MVMESLGGDCWLLVFLCPRFVVKANLQCLFSSGCYIPVWWMQISLIRRPLCKGSRGFVGNVIPYTSVIDQNGQVFEEILGEENVVEHHSGITDGWKNMGEDEIVENAAAVRMHKSLMFLLLIVAEMHWKLSKEPDIFSIQCKVLPLM